MNNLNHTDVHDVDEDLKTIAQHGGFWGDGNGDGITHRLVFDSQIDNLHAFSDVASLKNKNSLSQ